MIHNLNTALLVTITLLFLLSLGVLMYNSNRVNTVECLIKSLIIRAEVCPRSPDNPGANPFANPAPPDPTP